MTTLKWFCINILQTVFCFAWTALMITIAILVLCITAHQTLPLKIAHALWAPVIIWATGARLEVQGLEQIHFERPHIFVMNHQSTLDIPIIFAILPIPLRFIVKNELKWAPFVGLYVWAMGMIFIKRQDRDKAIQSLKRAARKIRAGASIIAYPEGTRSDTGEILPFKKGVFVVAIESQVPVVPVVIEGSRHVMPKNSFALRPGRIKILIAPPIPTEGLTANDRDGLTQEVHDQMVTLHKGVRQPAR